MTYCRDALTFLTSFTPGIIREIGSGIKGFCFSHIQGDLILQSDYMIELVTKVAMIGGVADLVNVVNKGQ